MEDWKDEPTVRLGHMECVVEESGEAEGAVQNIAFMYTLGKGACPRSFGINVARLANLPEGVLKIAQAKSRIFEEEMKGAEGEEKGMEELARQIKDAARRKDMTCLKELWDGLQAASKGE